MMKYYATFLVILWCFGLHPAWAQVQSAPAGDWYTFVLYAREPVPGTGKTWCWNGKAFDVGHSWWKLSTNDRNVVEGSRRVLINTDLSFMPVERPRPQFGMIQENASLDLGYNEAASAIKRYPITKTEFLLAVEHAKQVQEDTTPADNMLYNLNSYNCTDVALDAGAAAGQSMPLAYGVWAFGGHGNNPGVLGYNIRQLMHP